MATIDVLIPVYNTERYIGEAIDSVFAQDYPVARVIVVDDGSTDGTASVVKQYGDKVEYVYQDHSGIGPARNHCVRLSTGEYFAFIDADDLWLPHKLRLQMAVFQDMPDMSIVTGQIRNFISPEYSPEDIPVRVSTEPTIGQNATTALIKRSSFDQIGYFDESLASGPFINWNLKARKMGLQEYVVPEVVTLRRFHLGNHSYKVDLKRENYLRIIRESVREHQSRKNTRPQDDGV